MVTDDPFTAHKAAGGVKTSKSPPMMPKKYTRMRMYNENVKAAGIEGSCLSQCICMSKQLKKLNEKKTDKC